jgi:hypothetical protein
MTLTFSAHTDLLEFPVCGEAGRWIELLGPELSSVTYEQSDDFRPLSCCFFLGQRSATTHFKLVRYLVEIIPPSDGPVSRNM